MDRRAESKETRRLLGISRLVTLTGIGGVGKTRLALHVAHAVRSAFPDGVGLVELAELQDESLVAGVVAGALGLSAQPGRTQIQLLIEYLGPRQFLLVLDNCEQLVQAIAALVEGLLRHCPGLRILTTSREILGIDGEAVLPVLPLPLPAVDEKSLSVQGHGDDALALFAERAADVVQGFTITDQNYEAVSRICAVLEGIPLAVELAAARVRSLSPEQISQRLADRFALLTGGPRGVDARHQTLRAAVDWSYRLCSSTERNAWTHLSVFAGSFELDAAEQLLSSGPGTVQVLDVLTSLIDKSILIRDETNHAVRFRMLDTVSDYGREMLAQQNEAAKWRRRHRDLYFELARRADERWISQDQQVSIDRLARELPNLRQALAFAMSDPSRDGAGSLAFVNSLFRFWLARGMLSEGRHWSERALNRITDDEHSDLEKSRGLLVESVWADLQGDFDAGRSAVAQLWNLAARNSIPIVQARAAHADGFLAVSTGDVSRALSMLGQALDAFVSEHDITTQVEILLGLGRAHMLAGDYGDALESFRQVLAITEARGEVTYRSHAHWGSGVALWRIGDCDSSEQTLLQGIRLARARGDPLMTAVCLEALAWVADTRGDATRAATLMAAAEATIGMAGSSVVLFLSLGGDYHRHCAQSIQQSLGEIELEAVRRRASSLSLAAAAAYALGESAHGRAESRKQRRELTGREYEVATLVARGLTDKAIAAELVVSQRTVQGHVQHVLAKLGFHSRTQIAAWVVKQTGST